MNSPEQDNTQEEQAKTAAELAQEAAARQAEAAEAEQPAEEAADSVELEQLQQELAAAQAKADENWERALRLQAEMDNQRRRFDKQLEDAHKYSVQKFAESILPVIDSLEMGLQAEGDLQKIREGMELTLKQFQSVMDRFKLEAVGAVGDAFNPEIHQAVSMQPSPEHADNTLLAVMQKGYTLSGRTIRPAMVMVCKN
ncbi:MAG: nucleotide exchange factor GrpE [Thiolinea sp.]